MCRPILSSCNYILDGEECVHSLLSCAPTVPHESCCFLISLLAVQLELNVISEHNYVLGLYKQSQQRDIPQRAVDLACRRDERSKNGGRLWSFSSVP